MPSVQRVGALSCWKTLTYTSLAVLQITDNSSYISA